MIIDGTFTDVTIDTVTNRAPTWWNDPYRPIYHTHAMNSCDQVQFHR